MSSALTGISAQFPESVLLVNQLPTAVNFDLYKAAANGNLTLVDSLLVKGGKPNFINIAEGQRTSLHIAAENGHSEVVGLLLRNGAEINCIVGTTKVITKSTDFGVTTSKHLLIEKMKLITRMHILWKATALTLAAEKGHLLVIKQLLSSTPEPNLSHKNGYGTTALHEAAIGCFYEVATLLLAHSNHPDSEVSSIPPSLSLPTSPSLSPRSSSCPSSPPPPYPSLPLSTTSTSASTSSSSHLVSPLVAITNNKGSTPLHFLCYSEEHSSASIKEHSSASILFAKALILHGSNVNARDNKGVTPILVCCSQGRSDLIELLIANGGDIKVKDNIGKNALDTAAFYRQENLFPFLKSFNI